MRPDWDRDAGRERLARQVLDACEKRRLRVWQQFGSAYVGRRVQNRQVRAPRSWERVVEALSYEIACLLDITPAAARKRFGRALLRLQRLLSDEGLLE